MGVRGKSIRSISGGLSGLDKRQGKNSKGLVPGNGTKSVWSDWKTKKRQRGDCGN